MLISIPRFLTYFELTLKTGVVFLHLKKTASITNQAKNPLGHHCFQFPFLLPNITAVIILDLALQNIHNALCMYMLRKHVIVLCTSQGTLPLSEIV